MGENISIEQFGAVKMTVGRITSVVAVPDSEKMLRLSVDIGEEETRTILSGISKYYMPDDLAGRMCVVVSNLEPKTMLGIDSCGMLVCVSFVDGDGNPNVRIMEPPADTPVGSRLS